MNSKKAASGIIALILIILISVIIVATVWAFLDMKLKKDAEYISIQNELDKEEIEIKEIAYSSVDSEILVVLAKGAGEQVGLASAPAATKSVFSYVKILIFSDSGESYSYLLPAEELPLPQEEHTYTIDLSGFNLLSGEVKTIRIYPVANLSSGKEVIGSLLWEWNKPSDY